MDLIDSDRYCYHCPNILSVPLLSIPAMLTLREIHLPYPSPRLSQKLLNRFPCSNLLSPSSPQHTVFITSLKVPFYAGKSQHKCAIRCPPRKGTMPKLFSKASCPYTELWTQNNPGASNTPLWLCTCCFFSAWISSSTPTCSPPAPPPPPRQA